MLSQTQLIDEQYFHFDMFFRSRSCCVSLPLKVNIINILQEDSEVTKAFDEEIETPPPRNIPSPGQLNPDTRIPVINIEDGTRLVGEDAPKNKDLVEWLKMHPTYTVDMPSYVPVSDCHLRIYLFLLS